MMAGKIEFAVNSNECIVKLTGGVKYSDSSALEKAIDKCTEEESIDKLLVDLSDADSLDSTILGLLANLGIVFKDKLIEKPAMLVVSNDIKKLVLAVALDRVFNLTSVINTCKEYKSCKTSYESEKKLANRLLFAHKSLVSLSKENQEDFQAVIDLLEKNLQKDK